ncbi:proline-rich protein 36-like [Morone saxatilis]|uniref:proline-rich protein 36-like n=1 Tax=Morone saxatilis TaxID=34816 RepID=UPI0015E1EEF8|nr:proline-rich protein 36-like [Morone saxatilis]
MRWKTLMLYLVVMATLTSSQLSNGQTVEQRPSSPGSVHFSGVKQEPAAPTRHGSLTFKLDELERGDHKTVLHNLMNAKLKRMDPSVQCSDNLMTLKVKRARAPHFLVDSGEGPLTPLSQMPPKCGFSVKRSRRDVHFAAPYQGCHVTQQGGDYILPLRLWGAPMTMSCPAVLPTPTVSCFPSGMVVKIGGITANQLKVKVSGRWTPLLRICSSCGIAVEGLSGGLTLTAPYNRGLCIEIEDEKYLLSLLLADAELLVTCPLLLDVKPTTTTTTTATPTTDSGQALQYPQYPQFPMFPQYPVYPGATPPAHTPAPTPGTAAPLPQRPQLPSGAATDSASAAQQPEFIFMPQYPQFPQYPLFPRPVPPTQSTANKNTAAPPAQLPQMPQSPQYPQYPFPFFPQFPMVPGIFHSATLATTTEALLTTPAPTTKDDGKPHIPQQPKFLMPPEYPLLPFPKLPLLPEGQTFQVPKPVNQQPKPYSGYPQMYQIPVLYPPPKYPFQRQNTQTAAPATTSTTTAATSLKPAAQKPFYYPHPYMPAYYVPQQAPMPVFPDPPTTPLANPAPSDQLEQQPMYRAMPPFYPFPSHQRPKSAARNW